MSEWSKDLSPTDSYKDILDKTEQIWKKENAFKNIIKHTLKASRKYISSQKEKNIATTNLIECLDQLKGETKSDISWLIDSVQSTLHQAAAYQEELIENLTEEFIQPLSTFVEFKFSPLRHKQKCVRKSVRDYQNQMDQFEKSNTKDGKCDPAKFLLLEKELKILNQSIRQNTEEFKDAGAKLVKVKEFELLQSFTAFSKHLSLTFHKTSGLFVDIRPQLVSLEDTLQRDYREFFTAMEGYLLVKRNNGWSKEFCFIDNGKFYTQKDTSFDPDRAIDFQLCTLKPLKFEKGKDKTIHERCFQVVSPTLKKPLICQAKSAEVKTKWEKAILAAISQSLDNAHTKQSLTQSKNTSNTSLEKNNQPIAQILQKVKGNDYCADCGMEKPTWASINLGVLVCLNCSGVHRSLGVHISKVRSLTLDHWDPELVMYMQQLGNSKVNALYEVNLLEGLEKPTSESQSPERRQWIISKYQQKKFTSIVSEDKLQSLFDVVQQENSQTWFTLDSLLQVLLASDIEQPDNNGTTLLMKSVQSDNWLFAEALILQGANVFAVDNQNNTAFHYAIQSNHYRSLQVLIRFGVKEKDLTHSQNSLVDLASLLDNARENGAEECVKIIDESCFMGDKMLSLLLNLSENQESVSVEEYHEITKFDNMNQKEEFELVVTIPSPILVSSSDSDHCDSGEPTYKSPWVRGSESLAQLKESESKKSSIAGFLQRKKDKGKKNLSRSISARKRSNTGDKKIHFPVNATAPSVVSPTIQPKRERSHSVEHVPRLSNPNCAELNGDGEFLAESSFVDEKLENESDSSYDESGQDISLEEFEEDEEPILVKTKSIDTTPPSIPGFEFPTST